MKYLIFTILSVVSANAFAGGSIVIPTKHNSMVEIAWLGSEPDESQIELASEDYSGQDAVYEGEICFKGKRRDAIKVLYSLNDYYFMGDEYSIQNVYYVGPDRISYQVYDGPNETVATENIISACP